MHTNSYSMVQGRRKRKPKRVREQKQPRRLPRGGVSLLKALKDMFHSSCFF